MKLVLMTMVLGLMTVGATALLPNASADAGCDDPAPALGCALDLDCWRITFSRNGNSYYVTLPQGCVEA